ncbi:MAG TPA: M18 family aminopeptidase [Candidatus Dormibacteraeota bacterium]|nr:M18 family aminopeptidase [Candidatus Dormibacteraeota bacterium]
MPTVTSRAEAEGLLRFVDSSPTPYHACLEAAHLLESAGFTGVKESDSWPAGGLHYLIRGGTLIAWAAPESSSAVSKFHIVGAHTDSPNLRIRPQPEASNLGYRQLRVEVYGAPLLNSWLDRDLGVAGRVALASDGKVETRLIRVDRPLLRIPQLAPHLDPKYKTDGLLINPQTQLLPIWGLEATDGESFKGFLAGQLGVEADRVESWDLMTYDLAPSVLAGMRGEFVSAPRLDNLGSTYAATRALSAQADADWPGDQISVVCLFDHEEVGSVSSSGAAGALLPQVLERIVSAGGGGREEYLRTLAGSLCVSADMAHAVNPNYPDRSEPGHLVHLNRGPAIKVNARQRYATSASGAAAFIAACRASDTPYQFHTARGDVPGGSTIGPLSAAWLAMETVDVGIATLAMHSIRELCGTEDPGHLVRALSSFLTS